MPYLTRSCRFVTAMALFAGLLLGARDAAADRGASLAPAGWDSGLKLKEPADRNPDPSILEIDLAAKVAEVEVAPGLRVKAWTYDGGLPGPLIRAKVGDRVVVHFTNQLSGADDHPLAWRARADRDGRRAGHLAARGEDRRDVHLRLRACATRDCSGITRT